MTDTAHITMALADHYRIERELGHGGMATVYVARDLKHDREVALKVLHPNLAAVLGGERFLQEIRINAKLDHPHILTLIDSGAAEGFLYYVLPLVRGESLRDKLTREKQLSIEQTVRIATQVASALDYAHRHGVIHRDIKPENILLHEGEAVVADFGIALALREAGGPRLTESGLSLGTPQYMSPEQAMGGRELDARSDVYSLAAVVYEMLAGEPPHTGPTVQAVIAKLLTQRPTRIRTVRDTVPEGIDTAVAKALAKVPADRFTGAGEFAAALAGPGAESTAGWRHRRVAVAGSIAAAIALAAVGVWHPWRRPSRATPPGADVANGVAVLYFEARDTADTYLADGLTEDLTSLLGSVARVQVKSPGVVRRAQRASPGDAPAIARALGVRYLVDGNVRRVGTRVRVSTRLLNGATAVAAWGDVFDRTPDELLALPSLIAREVARRVGGPAPSSETGALGTLRTRSPAAYDHYLRGNFLLALRSPEGTARALAEYREAERLDSGFAAAIGRAAYAYAIARGNTYRLPDVPIDSLALRGLVLADRALRRDSTSSDAWMARGYLLAFAHPHTMAGSVAAFQRSIALDPKNAEAHHQYGAILSWLGRDDEASRELHLALALDPGRAISFVDLAAWTHARDTAIAVALMDSAVALDPASAFSRRWRALARLRRGDVRGAREDAELANRLQPGDIVMDNVLATVLARAGDIARARALISKWPGRADHWLIMAALVAVGDTAAALDRWDRASPAPYLWRALRGPEFDALHGNPRYERLLAALRPVGAVGQ
ncbi:MAG TPA: protein kinase [Gemmatimonadales bacterium]|nr:protein kinase [Gemmatimonadales bacterium]